MNKAWMAPVLIIISVFTTLTCFAVVSFAQIEEAFKVKIPDGWQAERKPGLVYIKDPAGTNGITIQFTRALGLSEKDRMKYLRDDKDSVIKYSIKGLNGKVTKDVERTIGGYYALQLDYTIPVNSMIGKMTYIVFFTDDCAFTVVYGSDNDDEKAVMDSIVESISF